MGVRVSPIYDPRFGKSKQREAIEQERRDAEVVHRMDVIKPAVIFALAAGFVMIKLFMSGSAKPGEPSGAALVMIYPIILAFSLIIGVAALWIASTFWLGGFDSLPLAILRLAATFSTADALAMLVGLPIFGWVAQVIVICSMLIWLFELEIQDGVMLTVILLLLKTGAGFVIGLLLMS